MDTPTTVSPSPILWGARAISSAIGLTPSATFHLLDGGKLPARKIGGRWVADRDVLLAFIRRTTTEAV